MQSFKTPTREQIETAVQRIRAPELAAYFFSRLQNPAWIAPLRQHNVFADPPPAVQVDGGGVSYPHWPASKYLARMARHAPNLVAEIFCAIRTNNASVISDLVDAALALPVSESSKLVPAVSQASREGALWVHFKEACDLCFRLAEGEQIDAALTLAEALFAPNFKEGEEEPSRRGAYWYKEGLKQVVPALTARKPRHFLSRLCEWLKAAVEAKRGIDPESGDDHSYIWRPAIEEHAQNSNYDFAGSMVAFVREAFELAIKNGLLPLDEALEILDGYRYLIFKRMRLHLIAQFSDYNPQLASETMLDLALFDSYEFKHEYASLAGRSFNLLSSEQQSEWFGWIDAGPDMSDFDAWIRNNLGRDATEDDRQQRVNYWKFEKLHFVRTQLRDERREFYERMLDKNGEPVLADLNLRMSTFRSAEDSPLTLEQLLSLTFEQALDAVSSWRPERTGFIGPNIRGLARTFGQYVATNPEGFSAKASALKGRPAPFVCGFLSRISQAIKAGEEIDWEPVFELCEWVVQRPVANRTVADDDAPFVDSDWQSTRNEICRLIEDVCNSWHEDSPRYSIDAIRQRLWNLLDSLYRDRAESNVIRDTRDEDCRINDYLLYGINSARGKAVGAALEYARWIANQVKEKEGKREIVRGGFEVMPEIREMLEWQISPGNRSVEALSVIGSRINLIYWIDRKWLEANANLLFQLENFKSSPDGTCGWAAWNAFLVWTRPHIDYYQCLRSQFAFAIEQSGKVKLSESSREQPMEHLGQHLLLLYARGQLDADDDRERFWQFLDSADPVLRVRSIAFAGHVLAGSEEIPTEVIARLRTLWEQYWDRIGKRDAAEMPDESLFGPWFACGRFSDDWALEWLERFVEVNPNVQPDDFVAERFNAIAATNVAMAARILDRVLRNKRYSWGVYSWMETAKRILGLAMKSSGEARETAVKVIDYLGRCGYTEFGQLLLVKNEHDD